MLAQKIIVCVKIGFSAASMTPSSMTLAEGNFENLPRALSWSQRWTVIGISGAVVAAGAVGTILAKGWFAHWSCLSLLLEGLVLIYTMTMAWRDQNARIAKLKFVRWYVVVVVVAGFAWGVAGFAAFEQAEKSQKYFVQLCGSLSILVPASSYAITKAARLNGRFGRPHGGVS